MADDVPRRPTVVVVMAEHGGVWLWNRTPGRDPGRDPYVVDPAALGVPQDLVERLDAWNRKYETTARHDFEFPSPEAELASQRRGHDLAHELQDVLWPDVEVLVNDEHTGEERPVRGRRRP